MRAKYSIISGAVVGIVFAMGLVAQAPAAVPASALEGTWEGTLTSGNGKIRIHFHFAQTSEGRLSAKMDSPDQHAFGVPVSSVTFDGTKLTATVASAGGKLEGRVQGDGRTIAGKWTQAAVSQELTLRPAKAIAVNCPNAS